MTAVSVSALLLLMAGLLLLAFTVGQDNRCDWARSHNPGSYQTYCQAGAR